MRVERIGDAVLMLGDCREILPTLGKVDAVVTDPPYGIGMDGGKIGRAEYEKLDWDSGIAQDAINLARSASSFQVIFGGNYYDLPPSGHWIVWDKQNDPTNYADFEMAWTNLPGRSRMIRHLWSGPYQKIREDRWHPTQKPVLIMEFCVKECLGSETILDPFMGSGTTGVACARLGRKFIGIELHEPYFDIACRRIEQAYRQADLFVNAPVANSPAGDRMRDLFKEPEA